ncbi:MAG: 16S rRNA (cytosine(1402)-N(4))-methyltransferase RsmH [Patescibacteria group bacterium]|jgi:16S rRNA (cytosine1402-N4)-methyltransferase
MKHIPVLKNEIVSAFGYLSKRAVFVDGTLGAAGHSIAIAIESKVKSQNSKVIGIDKDTTALEIAKENIDKAGLSDNFVLVHDDFKNIKQILTDQGIEKIDGALLDLGVSSMQLDERARGFSFNDLDQNIDMRMDQSAGRSAAEILNIYSEETLARILKEYGDERYARNIARNILVFRKDNKIKTVRDFVEIISHSIPPKVKATSKIHFATRSFQAIRIEVNAELRDLDKAISKYVEFLNPGGKLAVISFHSLEDEIVKRTFRKLSGLCECPPKMPCICGQNEIIEILTRKPVTAADQEITENPRSRSAKLRIAKKI